MFVTKVTPGFSSEAVALTAPLPSQCPPCTCSLLFASRPCLPFASWNSAMSLWGLPTPLWNVPVQWLCLDCFICSFSDLCSQNSGFLPQLQRIHQLPWICLYNLPLFFFNCSQLWTDPRRHWHSRSCLTGSWNDGFDWDFAVWSFYNHCIWAAWTDLQSPSILDDSCFSIWTRYLPLHPAALGHSTWSLCCHIYIYNDSHLLRAYKGNMRRFRLWFKC